MLSPSCTSDSSLRPCTGIRLLSGETRQATGRCSSALLGGGQESAAALESPWLAPFPASLGIGARWLWVGPWEAARLDAPPCAVPQNLLYHWNLPGILYAIQNVAQISLLVIRCAVTGFLISKYFQKIEAGKITLAPVLFLFIY